MNEVLTTNANHQTATFVKAKLTLHRGQTAEAVTMLTAITQNYPKWGEPFHVLALAHMRQGDIELAQKANETALQLSPGTSKYHTMQAQLMLNQGDTQNGGREATIALKLDPRNFMAAKLLAQALLQEKRFDDVIKFVSEVQKQVPDDPQILATLGMAHLGKKNIEQAKEIFSQLLAKTPANTRALAMVASLTAQGDIQLAITTVKEHIAKSPQVAGHYMLLGDLLMKDNRDAEALAAFGEAQKIAPKESQPYIIRGRLMHRMGKAEEAISEFEGLLRNDPKSIQGYLGLASVYESQKKIDLSKELYTKVLALQPDQPAAANNLAYILISEENGDLGEALRLAMLAKQAHPEDPRIADTLGMVHLRREAYGLAITQFTMALAENADDPLLNYHMALAQSKNGDTEQAVLFLEKALASEKPFAERAEAEKLLEELKG